MSASIDDCKVPRHDDCASLCGGMDDNPDDDSDLASEGSQACARPAIDSFRRWFGMCALGHDFCLIQLCAMEH